MSLEDLERRVQILEDIDAIKKLKARYTGYCDNGYDPEGIASLFTEDAVWDGGVLAAARGVKAFASSSGMRPRCFLSLCTT